MKMYGFFNNIHEFGDAEGVAIDETGEVIVQRMFRRTNRGRGTILA